MTNRLIRILLAVGLLTAAAGCGSSSTSTSTSTSTPPTAASSKPAATSASSAVGALSGEAASAATGDIPDNQAFLTFHNPVARYSISYPEGWARKGTGADTTLVDKNNVVHIVITKGAGATPSSVSAELTRLKQSNPSLTFTPPVTVHLKSGITAIKSTYTTRSAPNPVTGKTVILIVDRYELSGGGKRATVDLGTAKGVDNVDAYRMMISSFRWQ
jgi:hypothetical protein